MKYLLLFTVLFSAFAAATPLPEHMVIPSMETMRKHTDFIAIVTVENSLRGYSSYSFGKNGGFSEDYMLHDVTINKVIQHEVWKGAAASDSATISKDDRVYVRQWGSLEGTQFDGVPMLIPGMRYRLFLSTTHENEETTGAPIYHIVGKNGGLFREGDAGAFRGQDNTSEIELPEAPLALPL